MLKEDDNSRKEIEVKRDWLIYFEKKNTDRKMARLPRVASYKRRN